MSISKIWINIILHYEAGEYVDSESILDLIEDEFDNWLNNKLFAGEPTLKSISERVQTKSKENEINLAIIESLLVGKITDIIPKIEDFLVSHFNEWLTANISEEGATIKADVIKIQSI